MEATIAFVLGITVGLLAIMLISSFTGVLRIRKQIAELQKTNAQNDQEFEKFHNYTDQRFSDMYREADESHQNTMREIREITDQIHSTIEEINRYIAREQERQDVNFHQEIDRLMSTIDKYNKENNQMHFEDFNTLSKRLDEMSRYVDSRFDKTIDALSLRMDTMFVQKETDTTLLKS